VTAQLRIKAPSNDGAPLPLSSQPPHYALPEILRQQALRNAANLPAESFPVPAIVGMFSDEIEALRKLGRTDQQISDLIRGSSSLAIDPDTIRDNYAPPEQRGQHG